MRRRQSADSSLDEYEPADIEFNYDSGSETDLTDVDNDADGVNVVNKVNESNDFEDAKGVEEIDYADRLNDKAHPPEYYLMLIEEFNDSDFRTKGYSKGGTRLLDRNEEQWD